jgi:hypothetical protein
MNPQDLKQAITVISEMQTRYSNMVSHSEGIDFFEKKAFNLIIDYCHKMKYKSDGLPTDTSLCNEIIYKQWMLYVDKLTLVFDDVAQLHWHWVISFWPGKYESFEVFRAIIKKRVDGVFGI